MYLKRKVYLLLVILVIVPMIAINQFLPRVSAETTCEGMFQYVSLPLTELGSGEYVRLNGEATGVSGGLYPDGTNSRPAAHDEAGLAAAAAIQRLDANGLPDGENGRIVMVTVGMSNTDQESRAFLDIVRNDKNAAQTSINPNLHVVNGGRPGQSAEKWADPESENWGILDEKLTDLRYGGRPDLTPAQVQVAWVKQAHPMINRTTAFPDHVLDLQTDLEQISRNLKAKYPNLQIVYFSSRTRSYGYWDGVSASWGLLSPEPAAFETGFAVKWMLEKQINGDSSLNFDPAQGDVVAPFMAWGPYIWVNESPRADGFEWTQSDLEHDCTHPSTTGEEKIGLALESFFKSDSTAVTWFTEGADIQPPTPTPSPTATTLPPTATPTSSGRMTPTPPGPTATATAVPTETAVAPTATAIPPTATAIPPTATPTTSSASTIHVGNIEGNSLATGNRWQADATITVFNNQEIVQANVTVEGTWAYGGRAIAGSCTTDSSGSCTTSLTNIPSFVTDATFTVNNLDATLPYVPADNHDTNGDSDGTQMVIAQ